MPVVDCLNSVDVVRTPRVVQLEGLFDVPPSARSEQSFRVEMPIEGFPWSIGLIVGPSGSGKTTVARAAFGANLVGHYEWPLDRSLVDAFPAGLSIKEITAQLGAVGFCCPPSWLRPFHCLSSGEQFRVTLARAMAEAGELAVIDEFTSVVDRKSAQIGAAALAKSVRRSRKKLVAVTCHEDVINWLSPDWVLRMPEGEFSQRNLQGAPAILVRVERAHYTAWGLFRRHHYLEASLHRAAKCFVARYRNVPVAFASCLFQTSRGGGYWREHRTVCLPDYQGVGIGNALSEYLASMMIATGREYRSTTGNPAMILHRCRSPNWKLIRKPGLNRMNRGEGGKGFGFAASRTVARYTAGFQYMGLSRTEEARLFEII